MIYLDGCTEVVSVAVDAMTEREARERIKAFYGDVDDLLLMKVERL